MAILPAAVCMVIVAPRSAKLVEAQGARFTLLLGYVFCLLGFVAMLLLWKEDIAYWKVGLGYALIGHRRRVRRHACVALAHRLGPGPQGGHGVGHRRPPARPRRRDHAVDPRARCSPPATPPPSPRTIAASPDKAKITDRRPAASSRSRSRARRPRRASTRSTPTQIIAAAKQSFLDGDQWAYTAGIVAILLGAALVFFLFPKAEAERELLEGYAAQDAKE